MPPKQGPEVYQARRFRCGAAYATHTMYWRDCHPKTCSTSSPFPPRPFIMHRNYHDERSRNANTACNQSFHPNKLAPATASRNAYDDHVTAEEVATGMKCHIAGTGPSILKTPLGADHGHEECLIFMGPFRDRKNETPQVFPPLARRVVAHSIYLYWLPSTLCAGCNECWNSVWAQNMACLPIHLVLGTTGATDDWQCSSAIG